MTNQETNVKHFILSILLSAYCFSFSSAIAEEIPTYDADLTNFIYPYPVKMFEVKTQNQTLNMAYMDVTPEKNNGKAVLLLHGKNFGSYYWAPTMKMLLENGFRVVAVDQLGFGKSSKPAAYQFTFHALAENTRALLDSLKIGEVSVVGHSMGGMLAMRFALMYPKFTKKLVLVNPLGLEDWRLKIPYQSVNDLYAQELKTTPDTIREYQKKTYYAGNWKPEYETLILPQAGTTKSPDYSKIAWDSALTYEMIYTQPVVYELPQISMPTMLIIGQRDRTAPGKNRVSPEVAKTLGDYPKLGKKAATLIKHSKLFEIKEAGHVPQIEQFDLYKKALFAFLSDF
jgi:pimeloyl-ACP methyl ester carboxylesterase